MMSVAQAMRLAIRISSSRSRIRRNTMPIYSTRFLRPPHGPPASPARNRAWSPIPWKRNEPRHESRGSPVCSLVGDALHRVADLVDGLLADARFRVLVQGLHRLLHRGHFGLGRDNDLGLARLLDVLECF